MNRWIGTLRVALFPLLLIGVGEASAQDLTTLFDFGSRQTGQNPQSGVVSDQAGNLYGGAAFGGLNDDGVIYRLTDDGGAPWTETIIHKFTGPPDGSVPVGVLVISPSGDLFGTTLEGGAHDMGCVFELKRPTNPDGPWRERILYSFGSFAGDGNLPNAGLLPVGPGFYGVTPTGGDRGRGTVFLLTPPGVGGGEWAETILYSFTNSGDAAFPSGEVTMETAGNLYGNALQGGANNLGAVYQLTPPAATGEAWTESVIYSFNQTDGTLPTGQLTFDGAGNLYGTTDGGGLEQAGTVFRLTPPAKPGETWNQEVLFNFSGGRDGGNPTAGVIIANGGRLIGTASTGGNGPLSGGVVFRLNPPASDGDPWSETVLTSFGGLNGFRSLARPLQRGNILYGTTSAGGLNGVGTVFSLAR
jgi:uncharacterized repeat protein (TIGR03803 family)